LLLPFVVPFLSGVFWLAPVSLGEETVQVLLMFYRLVDPLFSQEKWWLDNVLAYVSSVVLPNASTMANRV
jgi:hypothetical protein